ncbi:uncharacterized protein [Nicotiana tomentosiformis]|uniref:uncharacterized protein n=1 Tax=Nicotiana tomentosiformis TaxID=4098 RepID=UPI00051BAA20|nr:uncharacterized protein LOC104101829 [Nicotiana tomentosiformis]
MGDFNTILSSEDRVQGNAVQEIKVRVFKNFIMDVGLDELRTVGRKFTWTNNHVHSRIDRILINAEWIQKWPAMEGIIMNPGFSDHCPLSLVIDDTSQEGRRPFKFLNCLENHKEFDDIVKHFWRKRQRENAMLKVWNKLKMLKGDLKQLNNQKFNNIGHKIEVARNKLEDIQAQITTPGNDNEAILQEKTAKLELLNGWRWMSVY